MQPVSKLAEELQNLKQQVLELPGLKQQVLELQERIAALEDHNMSATEETCPRFWWDVYSIFRTETIPSKRLNPISGTWLHDYNLNVIFNKVRRDNFDGDVREIKSGDVVGHFGAHGWYYVYDDKYAIRLRDARIDMEQDFLWIKEGQFASIYDLQEFLITKYLESGDTKALQQDQTETWEEKRLPLEFDDD